MSEAASEIPCPQCGAPAVRQMSGGAGLVFKGSGFYLTDYGRNAHRGTAPETSASRDKAESGAAASTESKPAESKSGDAARPEKSSDSKPADSKTSETKSSEPKAKEGKGSGSGAPPGSTGTKSET